MHYSTLLALALAFVGVDAKIAFTHTPGASITAGQAFTLTWDGGDPNAPVTITLKQGDPDDLSTVALITGNGQNGSYTWTPSTSLPDGDNYALEISQGTGYDDTNYSGEFAITGGAPSSASGAAATSSSSGSSGVVVTITSSGTTYTTTESTGPGTASGTVGLGNATTTSSNATLHRTSMTPSPTGGIQASSQHSSSATPTSTSSSAMAAQIVGGISGLAAAALGFAALL